MYRGKRFVPKNSNSNSEGKSALFFLVLSAGGRHLQVAVDRWW